MVKRKATREEKSSATSDLDESAAPRSGTGTTRPASLPVCESAVFLQNRYWIVRNRLEPGGATASTGSSQEPPDVRRGATCGAVSANSRNPHPHGTLPMINDAKPHEEAERISPFATVRAARLRPKVRLSIFSWFFDLLDHVNRHWPSSWFESQSKLLIESGYERWAGRGATRSVR